MAEYIDREAFKKSVEERYCKPCKAEGKDHNGCWCRACWVDDMLDEVDCFQPADVAPVVRCKDCIYYDRNHNEVAEWMRCTHNHIDVSDYWYCKSGTKKVGWRRDTRQNWYIEKNPDAKLDKNGVLKICPRKFDRNFNGQPIGCENDRCDKPMCDRCRGTYWEHEVVFNENGLLRSLLE